MTTTTNTNTDAPVWEPPTPDGCEWMDYWHDVAGLVAPSRITPGMWAWAIWHRDGKRPPRGVQEIINDGCPTAADARAACEAAAREWVERRERAKT